MPNHKLGKKKIKAPATDQILGKKGRKIMRKMQLRNGVGGTMKSHDKPLGSYAQLN